MKFKKLALSLICALCAMCLSLALTACGGTEDPDANLPSTTYVFYVYLDDGTTPVEGAQISVCFNTSETSGTCYESPFTTDSNGRTEIDMTIFTSYSSTYNPNGICVHFNELMGSTSPVGFPTGYTYPAGSQSIALNGAESTPYEHAWYITEQVTTFKLVKA